VLLFNSSFMKKIFFPFFLLLVGNTFSQKPEFKSEKDSASYAAGLNEGERMDKMLVEAGADTILNRDLFLQGFVDYMMHQPRMNGETSQEVLNRFFAKFQEKLEARDKKLREEYEKQFEGVRAKGLAYLEDNKTKSGVTVTPSGLQYEVLKKGKGKKIKIGDKVKVNYVMNFMDGTQVDKSEEPFEFDLAETGLIQGWIEAMQLMSKGSKFRVYVPWDLAYGEMGSDPSIPPYSVLIFEIEVVDHKPTK